MLALSSTLLGLAAVPAMAATMPAVVMNVVDGHDGTPVPQDSTSPFTLRNGAGGPISTLDTTGGQGGGKGEGLEDHSELDRTGAGFKLVMHHVDHRRQVDAVRVVLVEFVLQGWFHALRLR